LYLITQILIESDEYGRDAIVISVVGKTNLGTSERSDYCCITLKLLSEYTANGQERTACQFKVLEALVLISFLRRWV